MRKAVALPVLCQADPPAEAEYHAVEAACLLGGEKWGPPEEEVEKQGWWELDQNVHESRSGTLRERGTPLRLVLRRGLALVQRERRVQVQLLLWELLFLFEH